MLTIRRIKQALAIVAVVLFLPLVQGCAVEPAADSAQTNHAKMQFCTADINAYGHSSTCNCPEGGSYDPKQGKCLTITELTPTHSTSSSVKPLACTFDINPYGFSSMCDCPAGQTYLPRKGTCSSTLDIPMQTNKPMACTRDINQYGFASRCSCPSGESYLPNKGVCSAGQPLTQ